MKDEHGVGSGDKLIIGTKMRTVCDSVVVGNPEKAPTVDVLFNRRSIEARMLWPSVAGVCKVKRGPRKGKRRVSVVTAGWHSMSQQLLKGERRHVKRRVRELCRARVIPMPPISAEEKRIFELDPGPSDLHIATVRK